MMQFTMNALPETQSGECAMYLLLGMCMYADGVASDSELEFLSDFREKHAGDGTWETLHHHVIQDQLSDDVDKKEKVAQIQSLVAAVDDKAQLVALLFRLSSTDGEIHDIEEGFISMILSFVSDQDSTRQQTETGTDAGLMRDPETKAHSKKGGFGRLRFLIALVLLPIVAMIVGTITARFAPEMTSEVVGFHWMIVGYVYGIAICHVRLRNAGPNVIVAFFLAALWPSIFPIILGLIKAPACQNRDASKANKTSRFWSTACPKCGDEGFGWSKWSLLDMRHLYVTKSGKPDGRRKINPFLTIKSKYQQCLDCAHLGRAKFKVRGADAGTNKKIQKGYAQNWKKQFA